MKEELLKLLKAGLEIRVETKYAYGGMSESNDQRIKVTILFEAHEICSDYDTISIPENS